MALTHDDLRDLKAWFPVDDHEFDYEKNCYITEYAITNRLEEVDPSWSFTDPIITFRQEHGDEGMTVITASLAMTVKGVTRVGVGRSTIELRKNKKREANQAEKNAATDALKRAARLFGVGRYLLTLDGSVKDSHSLQAWFDKNKPSWLEDDKQVAQVKDALSEMMDGYGEQSVLDAKATLNPRQFLNATSYLDALDALAQSNYDVKVIAENTDPVADSAEQQVTAAVQEQQRQQAGDPPPNVTQGDFNKPPQGEAGKEYYGKPTKRVYSKRDRKDNPYMTISGATLYSREAFRKLGYDDDVIEALGNIGHTDLPDPVTIAYVMDNEFKNVVRIRRDSTGDVVDAKGQPVDAKAS